MSKVVGIIDHGTGNLFSVARAVEYVGGVPNLIHTADDILASDRLILPGVGAFGDCMAAVRNLGLFDAIVSASKDRPLMGVCVGLQMLFEIGEEMGEHEGLGLLAGRVVRLPNESPDGERVKIPHIGWNELHRPPACETWAGTVFGGLKEGEAVYFVHSFAPEPADPADIAATVRFAGRDIAVAVQRGNISGCQFHPERSGPAGLEILGAFLAS